MQGFVQSKNAAKKEPPRGGWQPGSDSTAESLKVPVPKPRSDVKHRDDSGHHPGRNRGRFTDVAEKVKISDGTHAAHEGDGNAHGRGLFDDTNASVFDDSTDFSDELRQNAKPRDVTPLGGTYVHGQRYTYTGNDQDADDAGLYDDGGQTFQRHWSNAIDMESLVRHKRDEARADGFVNQYIKGDSYPDTTSGWPSEIEENDERIRAGIDLPVQGPRDPPTDQRKGQGTRQGARDDGEQHPPSQAEAAQRAVPAGERAPLFARPSGLNDLAASGLNASFTMPPGPTLAGTAKVANGGGRSEPKRHGSGVQAPPDQHRLSGDDLRMRSGEMGQAGRAEPQPQLLPRIALQTLPQRGASALVEVRKRPPSEDGGAVAMAFRGVEHGAVAHVVDNEPNVPQGDFEQEQQRASTDYEPEQLFRMDYQTLTEQDFDDDPISQASETPGVRIDAPVADRLEAVAKLSVETQETFFASLKLDEWEEAGDWFLDRFMSVVSKLKEARRRKREAARSFEDEIGRRHVAVTKKRRLTEDAFAGMRVVGEQVLAGTPKKSKA